MIDIDRFLEVERKRINLALGQYFPPDAPPAVSAAMRYSLEAGGKRLRPILTLAAAKTLGSEDDADLEVACALEFIHTYSLIHDDLPAMDDSNLRRGIPSCHRVYGDAMAILAGDALLTLAFETVAGYGSREGYERKAVRIAAELSAAAGAAGMIGGQALDLDAEGRDISLSEIDRISALKTGALLRAAAACGGIAAGATEQQLKALRAYGSNIGKAFQVVDDLLDYESTTEELGKPAGADQVRFKATYPAFFGPEGTKKRAESFYNEALSALNELDCPAGLLKGLAKKIIDRKK